MKIKIAYPKFVQSLSALYEEREAMNMAAIVFEDEFEVKNFQREDDLSASQLERLEVIKNRLLKREPLQYVLGEADFYGLKFKVNPAVLIPRPETEELVFLALEETENRGGAPLEVLDIGTGSGCIPITLKSKRPAWKVSGVDVSETALEVAKANAVANKTEVNFFYLDILAEAEWPNKTYDIILSNPPYIPPSEKKVMPPQVLEFEPGLALFTPEEDPFLFYEKILKFAQKNLTPSGMLFFECNEYNGEELLEKIKAKGIFREVNLHQDMSGKNRMLLAKK